MPKYANKCPQHTELDLYKGCSFNCIYCISYEREQKNDFNLEKELRKIADNQTDGFPYYLSPWIDAYQHQEAEKMYTRQIINELHKKNHPFFVITKSVLIKRDLEFFKNQENTFIAISLNTLNNKITEVFESGAPSASERKQLLEELVADKSLKVVVKIDPIIPGVTDGEELTQLLNWLSDLKPYAVTAETLRLTKNIANRISRLVDKLLINRILMHYPELNLQHLLYYQFYDVKK